MSTISNSFSKGLMLSILYLKLHFIFVAWYFCYLADKNGSNPNMNFQNRWEFLRAWVQCYHMLLSEKGRNSRNHTWTHSLISILHSFEFWNLKFDLKIRKKIRQKIRAKDFASQNGREDWPKFGWHHQAKHKFKRWPWAWLISR